MDNNDLQKMHETEGNRKIQQLKQKISVTKHNMEVSSEIIDGTAADAQREKLTEKNVQRRHAISSMEKEIRDIKQTIDERGREV